ncbi:MAG: CopG family transcriptional regulator [Paraburkholderia sp.]|uniref:DUF411 domain-containing protein n=1 Tax=Paraburkholderia denitrificans TaxID=694025 RepID=A0ABW0J9Q9_9BURK|nr:DUF411 domain-containing protein [Paraburkholderia sp.]TAM07309.1 MAG: CopG family transcriptional regulator [Paraburkholderia sp.]TAM30812.1 MAG: CopG family transcriptional regulator [Paraburkholderia sp.]
MPKFRHSLVAALLAVLSMSTLAAIPAIVYKSPTCGCCEDYVSYLKQNGFAVTAINTDDMSRVEKQFHVTPEMASCHTVKIGNYVIEGHVPVAAIKRLLAEKPPILGLSIPGMPQHAPGMGTYQPGTLDVYELTADGRTGVLYGRF